MFMFQASHSSLNSTPYVALASQPDSRTQPNSVHWEALVLGLRTYSSLAQIISPKPGTAELRRVNMLYLEV